MITVIGLGFVGLTTALGFSKMGFRVHGIDVDAEKVKNIENLNVPFHEPFLSEVLEEQIGINFHLSTSLRSAINNSKAIFICVGTPSEEGGGADLSFILNALKNIIELEVNEPKTIVIKSTVPPSTVSKVLVPFVKANSKYPSKFLLCSNPEFLREGSSWEDFMKPDRVVLGVNSVVSKEVLQEVYNPFKAPLYFVTPTTAEFIKYLSNTLLSTLISFSNEMQMIADKVGDIDIKKAFNILHQDKRWFGNPAPMSSYVYPGCGYGGYCLPKDTAALISLAKKLGVSTSLLEANLITNDLITDHVVNKVTDHVETSEKLGIIGLSFKNGSDDVRSSPSYSIIRKLLDKGYKNILAYDPLSNTLFDRAYKLPISYSDSISNLIKKADHIINLSNSSVLLKDSSELLNKNVLDFKYVLNTNKSTLDEKVS